MSKMQALVRPEKNGRMSPLREKSKNLGRRNEAGAPLVEERAEQSLTSDVRSNKSMPKPQTKKPGYEHMRIKKHVSN